jgi:hypothetical protein
MVTGIVLAAVLGAQLLAVGVGIGMGEVRFNLWEIFAQLVNSIPASLGWVIIVFMILQKRGVNPKVDDEAWNPKTLPMLDEEEEVKKGRLIFGITAGTILLALLAAFSDRIGIVVFPGGAFYPNPVIVQMIPWICISLLASIGLDIYLLWQGTWNLGSRIARIVVNLVSIAVLVLLVQGHTAWLNARGSNGFFFTLENFAAATPESFQNMSMAAFNLAFVVALVVTIVETILLLIKLVRSSLTKSNVPGIQLKN